MATSSARVRTTRSPIATRAIIFCLTLPVLKCLTNNNKLLSKFVQLPSTFSTGFLVRPTPPGQSDSG